MKVNYELAPFPAKARTATTTILMPLNRRHTGCLLFLNVTAASGTGGLTVKVQAKDPISGSYIDLLADPAPITTTGAFGFELNPADGTASAGVRVAASRHLPQEYWISVVHGDGSSYTYSLSATLFV